MTPEEQVRSDALIATGMERKAVRRMLATQRTLFATLRARRLARNKEAREEHYRLMAEQDDEFPPDEDDRDEGHCWECGVPMFGQSGVICDECEYPF